MLEDLLFVAFTIGLWFLIGYPVAARLGAADKPAYALAPIFGLSFFVLTVTLLYRFGLPLNQTLWPNALLAVYGFVVLLRRDSRQRASFYALTATLLLTAIIVLLPKWLGSAEFAVFQGNHWDHLNYLSYTSAFRHHPYAYFGTLSETEALRSGYSAFAATQLHARPSVGLVFGSLLTLFGGETSRWSYAYLAVLQSLMFCSAFFVFSFGLRIPFMKSALAAVALTCGFYMQYAFDINAWSQLAAMPIGLALLGVLILALSLPGRKDVDNVPPAPSPTNQNIPATFALIFLASALSYVYPEALPVYGPAYLATATVMLMYGHARSSAVKQKVTMLSLTGAGALALCTPVWSATFGHLFEQLKFATTSNLDWHGYFQCYFLDNTCRADLSDSPSIVASIGRAYEIFIRFFLGAFGLYFLAPSTRFEWPPIFASEIIAPFAVLMLLAACIIGVKSALQRNGYAITRALLFAGAASLIVAVTLAITGRYWAASKAVAIVAPLLFILACIPITKWAVVPTWSRMVVWAFIMAHLGFGLARSLAATAESGVHYEFPPYPSAQDATLKANYSWDTQGRYAAAKDCKLVQISISNPFLDRFAQVFLTDNAIPWFSTRPIKSYYSEGSVLGRQIVPGTPDCLMTAEFPIDGSFERIIWLAKDDSLMSFYLGQTQSVELLGKPLSSASAEGFYGLEQSGSNQWRWTNGAAGFSIPSNPAAPTKKLTVSASSMTQMNRLLTIEVEGIGTVKRELSGAPVRIEFDISGISTQQQIRVNLISESSTLPGDTRRLGVAVHELMLAR